MGKSSFFTAVLCAVFGLLVTCSTPVTTGDLLEGNVVLSDKTTPTIISPASTGGGRAPNLKTTLIWATKIPARYYEVEVASDSAFQNPISGSPFKVSAPTTELAITLPDAMLAPAVVPLLNTMLPLMPTHCPNCPSTCAVGCDGVSARRYS